MWEYVVKFEYDNVPYAEIVKRVMREELIRAHNEFCNITNGGLLDRLNKEFDELYPDYQYSENFWDSAEYIEYIRKEYDKIADGLNRRNFSAVLDFYIGDDLELEGRLKILNQKGTISFYLAPEES